MTIFTYLEEKDIFRMFYRIKLCKRLLHNISASDKAEANMISKLKEACGFEYTNELQRMLAGRLLPLLRMRRLFTTL
jgi:cullin 1